MHAHAVFVELRLQDTSVLLRLQPDRERSVRALAHGAGYALSHLDTAPTPAMRAVLADLAASFENAGAKPAGESAARSALERAVRDVVPIATLHTRRRVPIDQRVPRWPLRMRSGAPDPARRRLWPYDVETAAMRLGQRRLVLREWLAGGGAHGRAALL